MFENVFLYSWCCKFIAEVSSESLFENEYLLRYECPLEEEAELERKTKPVFLKSISGPAVTPVAGASGKRAKNMINELLYQSSDVFVKHKADLARRTLMKNSLVIL